MALITVRNYYSLTTYVATVEEWLNHSLAFNLEGRRFYLSRGVLNVTQNQSSCEKSEPSVEYSGFVTHWSHMHGKLIRWVRYAQ